MIWARQRTAYKGHPQRGAVMGERWVRQIMAAQESLNREIEADADAA
jgi:hypothetical protein